MTITDFKFGRDENMEFVEFVEEPAKKSSCDEKEIRYAFSLVTQSQVGDWIRKRTTRKDPE